jgi:Arc/MetJ-type ribon-helix-helix transcriptional regulator
VQVRNRRVRIRASVSRIGNYPAGRPIDGRTILWQSNAINAKLKTVHITLTPQIAELLEAEVAAGRFANLSEALRSAAWKAFAEDPAAVQRLEQAIDTHVFRLDGLIEDEINTVEEATNAGSSRQR